MAVTTLGEGRGGGKDVAENRPLDRSRVERDTSTAVPQRPAWSVFRRVPQVRQHARQVTLGVDEAEDFHRIGLRIVN
jgi:hypothetical protein